MRRLSIGSTLIALGSLTLATSHVRADDKADITALYGKLTAAMKAKDIKGVMATGTPDFTMKEASGKVYNAKDAATMMDSQFKMMKSVDEVKMTPKTISIKGKTAVVMGDFVMKVVMTGPDGKDHKFAGTGLTKDTFVKTPKGWLVKSTETVKESMMMDGKPFDPAAAGGAPPTKKKK